MIRNDEYQLEISQRIVDAFSSGKKNIVLEAPTGSGKSGMAWFTHKLSNLSTAVLSHQKILQDQYDELLNCSNNRTFMTLKGQGNYKCNLNPKVTVDNALCANGAKFKCVLKSKKMCDYWRLREDAKTSTFLNMNYQQMYLLYDNNVENEFAYKKDLFIFDECHKFRSLYTDIRSVEISNKEIEEFKKISELADEDGYGKLLRCSSDLIKYYKKIDFKKTENSDEYGLETYKEIDILKTETLSELNNVLDRYENDLTERGKYHIYSGMGYNLQTWNNKYNKIFMYKDYLIDKNNFVIESVSDEGKISSKLIPLDISVIFKKECNELADKFLFMSSTIFAQEKFIRNLGLNVEETEFISLDSKFPLENRSVFTFSYGRVNKQFQENDKELEIYFKKITQIVIGHSDMGHSGVIFVPSYGLAKQYVNSQYKILANNGIKLIYNLNSEDRDDVIEKFTDLEDKTPKVLISPSFTEGVNFNDDISRYQIIMKVPYKYLGSKYIRVYKDRDPMWYQLEALTEIVQCVGRSIRHKEDYADTYITDTSWNSVYSSCKKYIPKWFDDSITTEYVEK